MPITVSRQIGWAIRAAPLMQRPAFGLLRTNMPPVRGFSAAEVGERVGHWITQWKVIER